jgi:hypothetical protein
MEDILKNIAATLARQGAPMLGGIIGTAIGGPAGTIVGGLAGRALETVAEALGVSATPEELPAAIDAHLQAEGTLAGPAIAIAESKASDLIRLTELENERIKAQLADVQASRAQMASLVEKGNPMQFLPAMVTFALLFMLGAVLAALFWRGIPENTITMLVIGSVMTMTGQGVTYWLGSSAGSKAKDAMIAKGPR